LVLMSRREDSFLGGIPASAQTDRSARCEALYREFGKKVHATRLPRMRWKPASPYLANYDRGLTSYEIEPICRREFSWFLEAMLAVAIFIYRIEKSTTERLNDRFWTAYESKEPREALVFSAGDDADAEFVRGSR
jgi:hypothetical protein